MIDAFVAAFRDTIEYCDCEDERILDSARKNVIGFFSGERGTPLPASRLALVPRPEGERDSVVGAALVIGMRGGSVLLDVLFVTPEWQRAGVATALVSSVVDHLHDSGHGTLKSRYNLGNDASRAWHRKFGFVDDSDSDLFMSWRNRTRDERHAEHELWRREKLGDLDASRSAAAPDMARSLTSSGLWYGVVMRTTLTIGDIDRIVRSTCCRDCGAAGTRGETVPHEDACARLASRLRCDPAQPVGHELEVESDRRGKSGGGDGAGCPLVSPERTTRSCRYRFDLTRAHRGIPMVLSPVRSAPRRSSHACFNRAVPLRRGRRDAGDWRGPGRRMGMLGWPEPHREPFRRLLVHPAVVARLNELCGVRFRLDHGPRLLAGGDGTGASCREAGSRSRPPRGTTSRTAASSRAP